MTLQPLAELLPAVVAQLSHHNPGRTPPMTARTAPDSLHDDLVERVDDWVENVLAPQDCAAALKRVLEVARSHEHGALRWEDQLPVPEWVQEIRHAIAGALGVPLDGPERAA